MKNEHGEEEYSLPEIPEGTDIGEEKYSSTDVHNALIHYTNEELENVIRYYSSNGRGDGIFIQKAKGILAGRKRGSYSRSVLRQKVEE